MQLQPYLDRIGYRGGWCYEQNGLFGWALSAVGYDVTRVVNVGFDGSMFEPIPLEESGYEQPPFRIGLKQISSNSWRFWEDIGSGEFSFDFAAKTADEAALSEKCAFLQSDPASSFVLNLVAQLRLPERHKTLRGRVLSIATPDGSQSSVIDSAEGIVADLWPNIVSRHEDLLREKALTDTNEACATAGDGSLS